MIMIESKNNPRFKEWKKLHTKKGRKESGLFLIEGEHLVEEALKSDWAIVDFIVSSEYRVPDEWMKKYPVLMQEKIEILAPLFSELSETQTPQGIAAVIKKRPSPTNEDWLKQAKLMLLVDQIQDPGNLGTMIRTADAAGVDAVVLGKGTVDPFSGKVLRSSQGSTFHLPLIEKELQEYIVQLQQEGWQIYGTSLTDAIDFRELEITPESKVAIVMGNEGEGVQEALLEQMNQKIKIPIWGQAESLNVAIATGILLYHTQSLLKK
ncbi:TrmH family RNA methyltransferase [Caldalkalibacillus mannanilyticus]|uniref:TrmH family RNA methyltransferase n=1 Tax=Caldalkalibacillus mannanilyticus TaxID=1418 RepID=UPI00046AC7BC|nr:RNA methyltransferase [Caldalkalibacillus mannanilyticus]